MSHFVLIFGVAGGQLALAVDSEQIPVLRALLSGGADPNLGRSYLGIYSGTPLYLLRGEHVLYAITVPLFLDLCILKCVFSGVAAKPFSFVWHSEGGLLLSCTCSRTGTGSGSGSAADFILFGRIFGTISY